MRWLPVIPYGCQTCASGTEPAVQGAEIVQTIDSAGGHKFYVSADFGRATSSVVGINGAGTGKLWRKIQFNHHPASNNSWRRPACLQFQFFLPVLDEFPQSRPKTNNIRGTIFLLHGYGLNKATMMPWGFLLAEAGYRVVLVDLRGHGNSTGDRIYFGSVEKTDLVQCLDALEHRNLCEGPVGVLGISYGAALALQWAAVDPRVQSVTAISPYSNPGTAVEQFLRTYVPQLPWWTDRKAAGEVARSLAAECADLTTETVVRRIKNPILFVRGENDELCSKADLNHLEAVAPVGIGNEGSSHSQSSCGRSVRQSIGRHGDKLVSRALGPLASSRSFPLNQTRRAGQSARP